MKPFYVRVLILFAFTAVAGAQCSHTKYFSKPEVVGRDVSVQSKDFSIDKIVCLAQHFRKENPSWQEGMIFFFRSKEAARHFNLLWYNTDAPDTGRRWNKYLHAIYVFDSGKQEEYLKIYPLGYETDPSLVTRLDSPVTFPLQCRITFSGRCALILEQASYPKTAVKEQLSGDLILKGTITKEGLVRHVRMVQSSLKQSAAKDALIISAIQNLAAAKCDRMANSSGIRVRYVYQLLESPCRDEGTQYDLSDGKIVVSGCRWRAGPPFPESK